MAQVTLEVLLVNPVHTRRQYQVGLVQSVDFACLHFNSNFSPLKLNVWFVPLFIRKFSDFVRELKRLAEIFERRHNMANNLDMLDPETGVQMYLDSRRHEVADATLQSHRY